MKLLTMEGDEGARGAARSVDTYSGLSIHVSFSDANESKSISALSGGQKTLVALALIFAIQRADPAPFYVFDEIDSALDATHRAAVGALIKLQASAPGGAAQFIVSTFHPEILDFGDKFFGVSSLQKNTSEIEEMKKDETVAFVHAILEEERAKLGRAPVGASPASSAKKPRRAAAALK
jgi:structural maintenance of chromosome 3 (chondroitin sulfate proteoglycan 6)